VHGATPWFIDSASTHLISAAFVNLARLRLGHAFADLLPFHSAVFVNLVLSGSATLLSFWFVRAEEHFNSYSNLLRRGWAHCTVEFVG